MPSPNKEDTKKKDDFNKTVKNVFKHPNLNRLNLRCQRDRPRMRKIKVT